MTKELWRRPAALRRFLRSSEIRNPNSHRFQPDFQISPALPKNEARRTRQGRRDGFVIRNILPETTIRELNSLFRAKKKRRH